MASKRNGIDSHVPSQLQRKPEKPAKEQSLQIAPNASTPDRIPLSCLLTTTRTSSEAFELNRLAHAANIEKEIQGMRLMQRRAEADAEVARWLLDNRDKLLNAVGWHLDNAGLPRAPK
jgi:hypothetical protein